MFQRVLVNYLISGQARIAYELTPGVCLPAPLTFQLQVAEADVATANWSNVGSPVTNSYFLSDTTQRAYGKELTIFYRIKLTVGNGVSYYSQAVGAYSYLPFREWNQAQEIIRKEQLRGQLTSVPGYLLKAKRSGTPCDVCLDPYTKDVTDARCPNCLSTRWLGGYYDAVPNVLVDFTPYTSYPRRDHEQQGTVRDYTTTARMLAVPFLSTFDIWVHGSSDERYAVHSIRNLAQIKSVPLIHQVELRLVPYDDVVYTFPIHKF